MQISSETTAVLSEDESRIICNKIFGTFSRSYEGYSEIEDLMCYCIGVAAAKWDASHDSIYWQIDFPLYQYEAIVSLLHVGSGILWERAIDTDSPVAALKSLLDRLMEAE